MSCKNYVKNCQHLKIFVPSYLYSFVIQMTHILTLSFQRIPDLEFGAIYQAKIKEIR